MNYPPIPIEAKKKFDPIQWWKGQKERLPLLTKTFKSPFCISATSVPSERAFSTTKNIVTGKRNSLTPHNIEILGFFKQNYSYIPINVDVTDISEEIHNTDEKQI